MNKIRKKSLPYAGTKIDPADTIAEIKKMLKNYGIEDVADVTMKGETTLHFIYHAPDRDATFQIKPPTLTDKKRTWNIEKGKYEILDVPMVAQAWRLVYWYLQIKLKAVSYGLISVEREFLNQMLSDDGRMTAGDYILSKIEHDKGVLKLEAPAPPTQEPKQINAEFEVKES